MADTPSDPPKPDEPKRNGASWSKAGIGIGIGSAAIVAALLYVNYGKKKPGN